MFGPIDTYYWIFMAINAILVLSNIYFKGCLFLKTERYLFNDKEWYGLWNIHSDIDSQKIKKNYWFGVVVGMGIIIYRNTTQILYPFFGSK